MKVRNAQWEEKKQIFLNKNMELLKQKIIDHAKSEHRKVENIRIQERLKEERRRKDESRERRERLESGQAATAGSPAKAGDPEASEWKKGVLKPPEAEESPAEKPKPKVENAFITRSDRKRDPPKQEENKEGDSAGLRRNRAPPK